MKKAAGFLVSLLVVSVLLVSVGCNGGTSKVYPLNPTPDYYHVSLTVGGQQATLNYGRPDINVNEPTLVLNQAGNQMVIDSGSA